MPDDDVKGSGPEEEGKEEATSIEAVKTAIGPEGTIASMRSRIPKVRFDPETETLVEEKPASQEPDAAEADEKAASEAKEKGKKKGKGEGEEEFKPKYKTHQEAEKGVKEAERLATTRAEEAKVAKEALAARDTEVAELKAKLAEKEGEKPPEKKDEIKPVSREERKTQLLAVAKTANAKALKAISEIDKTLSVEEWNEKAAECWAEAHTEALLEAGITASSLTEAEVDKLLDKKLKASKEAEVKTKAAETQAEADARVREDVTKIATDMGLDMKAGSHDFRLFWSIADELRDQEFMKAETPPTLKEQVDWVVKGVQKLKGTVVQVSEAEKERQRLIQERQTPLGRGVHMTPVKEEPLTEPVKLSQIRRGLVEKARAKQQASR